MNLTKILLAFVIVISLTFCQNMISNSTGTFLNQTTNTLYVQNLLELELVSGTCLKLNNHDICLTPALTQISGSVINTDCGIIPVAFTGLCNCDINTYCNTTCDKSDDVQCVTSPYYDNGTYCSSGTFNGAMYTCSIYSSYNWATIPTAFQSLYKYHNLDTTVYWTALTVDGELQIPPISSISGNQMQFDLILNASNVSKLMTPNSTISVQINNMDVGGGSVNSNPYGSYIYYFPNNAPAVDQYTNHPLPIVHKTDGSVGSWNYNFGVFEDQPLTCAASFVDIVMIQESCSIAWGQNAYSFDFNFAGAILSPGYGFYDKFNYINGGVDYTATSTDPSLPVNPPYGPPNNGQFLTDGLYLFGADGNKDFYTLNPCHQVSVKGNDNLNFIEPNSINGSCFLSSDLNYGLANNVFLDNTGNAPHLTNISAYDNNLKGHFFFREGIDIISMTVVITASINAIQFVGLIDPGFMYSFIDGQFCYMCTQLQFYCNIFGLYPASKQIFCQLNTQSCINLAEVKQLYFSSDSIQIQEIITVQCGSETTTVLNPFYQVSSVNSSYIDPNLMPSNVNIPGSGSFNWGNLFNGLNGFSLFSGLGIASFIFAIFGVLLGLLAIYFIFKCIQNYKGNNNNARNGETISLNFQNLPKN